jgi:hypothetical protein
VDFAHQIPSILPQPTARRNRQSLSAKLLTFGAFGYIVHDADPKARAVPGDRQMHTSAHEFSSAVAAIDALFASNAIQGRGAAEAAEAAEVDAAVALAAEAVADARKISGRHAADVLASKRLALAAMGQPVTKARLEAAVKAVEARRANRADELWRAARVAERMLSAWAGYETLSKAVATARATSGPVSTEDVRAAFRAAVAADLASRAAALARRAIREGLTAAMAAASENLSATPRTKAAAKVPAALIRREIAALAESGRAAKSAAAALARSIRAARPGSGPVLWSHLDDEQQGAVRRLFAGAVPEPCRERGSRYDVAREVAVHEYDPERVALALFVCDSEFDKKKRYHNVKRDWCVLSLDPAGVPQRASVGNGNLTRRIERGLSPVELWAGAAR